jgi:GTP-binding protein Era
VDARAGLTDAVRGIVEGLKRGGRPSMLALNKVDLIPPERLLPLTAELTRCCPSARPS